MLYTFGPDEDDEEAGIDPGDFPDYEGGSDYPDSWRM